MVIQLLFVECCFKDLFKTVCSIFVKFLSNFFSMHFISIQVVHLYNSTETTTAWKKSSFIFSERADFHMINNLSIAVHAFTMHILILLSVDEILLPRYMNWSTDFRDLPLNMVMVPCWVLGLSFVKWHINFCRSFNARRIKLILFFCACFKI